MSTLSNQGGSFGGRSYSGPAPALGLHFPSQSLEPPCQRPGLLCQRQRPGEACLHLAKSLSPFRQSALLSLQMTSASSASIGDIQSKNHSTEHHQPTAWPGIIITIFKPQVLGGLSHSNRYEEHHHTEDKELIQVTLDDNLSLKKNDIFAGYKS